MKTNFFFPAILLVFCLVFFGCGDGAGGGGDDSVGDGNGLISGDTLAINTLVYTGIFDFNIDNKSSAFILNRYANQDWDVIAYVNGSQMAADGEIKNGVMQITIDASDDEFNNALFSVNDLLEKLELEGGVPAESEELVDELKGWIRNHDVKIGILMLFKGTYDSINNKYREESPLFLVSKPTLDVNNTLTEINLNAKAYFYIYVSDNLTIDGKYTIYEDIINNISDEPLPFKIDMDFYAEAANVRLIKGWNLVSLSAAGQLKLEDGFLESILDGSIDFETFDPSDEILFAMSGSLSLRKENSPGTNKDPAYWVIEYDTGDSLK